MAESRTAAQMARLIAQWNRSGESGASVARRHGIPAWTFWYWRRKLATAVSADAPSHDICASPDHQGRHRARGGDRDHAREWRSRPRTRHRVAGARAGRGAGLAFGVLTISPAVRIYVATGATDLRRSIDGLAALVRARFALNPLSGARATRS